MECLSDTRKFEPVARRAFFDGYIAAQLARAPAAFVSRGAVAMMPAPVSDRLREEDGLG
jgi:hypothetical protein